jgi:hypothetical protein
MDLESQRGRSIISKRRSLEIERCKRAEVRNGRGVNIKIDLNDLALRMKPTNCGRKTLLDSQERRRSSLRHVKQSDMGA